MTPQQILTTLKIESKPSGVCHDGWAPAPQGGDLPVHSPVDGSLLATVRQGTEHDMEGAIVCAHKTFQTWRMAPAPKRGEIVREIGELLRQRKETLGALVSLEMGKIKAEGEGEVQEMIDMADFCVGLSRQLYGLTMHSERPLHRMYEQWHPLGVVGIITAFNFPVAVWAWNAFAAAVCGNTMVWKPSPKTPLTGIAIQHMVNEVLDRHNLRGVMNLVIGADDVVGERLIADQRVPLISATGSARMGRHVNQVVAGRLGRCLLELGGNNALIVARDAPMDLALQAVLFGAVGTAGQRCTTTRRVYLDAAIAEEFTQRLIKAYKQVLIGSPLAAKTLMGPLIDTDAVAAYHRAVAAIKEQGGEILYGGEDYTPEDKALAGGHYVLPTIARSPIGMPLLKEEVFAPIVHLVTTSSFEEALAAQNDVPQGLSSALFTDSMRQAETFLSHQGSDCGIANVNIGTSGAEIGGAFGGEKETGGGREAGSDAWKAYMRRQTCTINWGETVPLAQGIVFSADGD